MQKITTGLLLSASLIMLLEASQGSASASQMVHSRSLVDTLNVGLEDTVHIGFSPGDIIMEVHRAPGDLSLYGLAVSLHALLQLHEAILQKILISLDVFHNYQSMDK